MKAVQREKWPIRPAGQDGVEGPTAEGYLVRIEAIDDMRRLNFHSWEKWHEFTPNLSTNRKGSLAVQCVVAAMKLGRFPFWLNATEDERENIQLKGTDIVVFCRKRIQVKCDYRAGQSGNLYLQKAECNPMKRH